MKIMQRLKMSTEDAHFAYMYSFGVYEGYCYTTKHTSSSCRQTEVVVNPQTLPLSSWWHKGSDESKVRKTLHKWPTKPSELKYEQVHKYTETAPWCTYMLLHPDTVAASSLTSEDGHRFMHTNVTNKQLFSGCVITPETEEQRRKVEKKIHDTLKLVNTNLVPCSVIEEECEKLEHDLLNRVANQEMYLKIMDQRDDTEKDTEKETEMEEIIKHTVQKCLLEQSHIFMNWLHRMKKLGTLTVDKEVQKNDWFVANIEEFLMGEGFRITKVYSHNKYCIFGRSRPDCIFTRLADNCVTTIKVGILMQTSEELFVDISGGSVEFKLTMGEDFTSNLPQAIANMIRAACNIAADALKVGKIINNLVVYGLLVSYDRAHSIPIKYQVNYQENDTRICVGENEPFSRMFPFILLYAL